MPLDSSSVVNWNRRIAVFDLDGTLLKTDSLPSFLNEVYRQDPKAFRKRVINLRGAYYLAGAWIYERLYRWGLPIPEPSITRFGTRALRHAIPNLDLRFASKQWFELTGRQQLNEVVVQELYRLRSEGYRTLLASSSLDLLVKQVAEHLQIDPDDVIYSTTEQDSEGRLHEIRTYRQGDRKAAVIQRRIEAIQAQTRQTVDLANSRLYSDSRSDLPILKNCGIKKLTAVGTDLDDYLRANGGRRIQVLKGGVTTDEYVRVPRGPGWEPKTVDVQGNPRIPREHRSYGRWLVPTQWLLGDIVSEWIRQRKFCLPSREGLTSAALFAGSGAVGETVAREIYNYARRFPTFYAGPDVRGGGVGGVIHLVGSLCGMISMELYHHPQDAEWGAVFKQSLMQFGCWSLIRGATFVALKPFGISFLGNPLIQLAELIAFPVAEFTLMKWANDWNYRQAFC